MELAGSADKSLLVVGERDQRWLPSWVMERKIEREKECERERECERYQVERERANVKFY